MAQRSRHQRSYALVGVLIALSWPSLANVIGASGSGLTSVRGDIRTMIVEGTVASILAVIAFGAQRLRPGYFRLAMFSGRDFLYMLGAMGAAFIVSAVLSRLVAAPAFDLREIASVPIAVRVALVITAGMCEEFIFRGFAIEQIGLLTGNRWLGAALSVIFFGLGHVGVYGFSTALLLPTTIGLMITLLYMLRNNLPVCMLMHATIDGLAILLAPALSPR